ncbi:MAG: TMEM165/GDT1 family protein [Candidatus Omnitrophica bacterium]|jgi:putative Ca2+/H+ antiporter (TMEM165/GDT1 family)|nr:TMEM165/GDT1 family protein [Candidatus Omnitrophota bacterium]
MPHPILSSFFLVAVSEMGDKTQLLAFSLAVRFKKPWAVMAGILTATLLNHALASWSGEWISRAVRPELLAWMLGVSFIGFGIWTLFPDKLENTEHKHRLGPYLTTCLLFFLAEMGDKTQLATIALGARFGSAIAVTIGTTLGMMLTDGLAVFLGEKMSGSVPMNWVRRGAAALFFLFGALSIVRALNPSWGG